MTKLTLKSIYTEVSKIYPNYNHDRELDVNNPYEKDELKVDNIDKEDFVQSIIDSKTLGSVKTNPEKTIILTLLESIKIHENSNLFKEISYKLTPLIQGKNELDIYMPIESTELWEIIDSIYRVNGKGFDGNTAHIIAAKDIIDAIWHAKPNEYDLNEKSKLYQKYIEKMEDEMRNPQHDH